MKIELEKKKWKTYSFLDPSSSSSHPFGSLSFLLLVESSSATGSASLDEQETEELGVGMPTESPTLGFLEFSSMEEEITSGDEQDKSKALERVL